MAQNIAATRSFWGVFTDSGIILDPASDGRKAQVSSLISLR